MADPTTPRVPMLSMEAARAAAKEAGVNQAMAGLSVFRMLLTNPKVARALNDQLETLLWKGVLDKRLRELIIMRIGWVTGSVYEWTQHWRVARGMKISEEELVAVKNWRTATIFEPAARAVLAATDETLDTGTISDATWRECAAHVPGGDAALIEMVVAIGNWSLFSTMLRSLAVPLEDGVKPWPPDGAPPSGA